MIRVLVADDHPVVRSGVRAMSRETPDIEVRMEVDTAAGLLRELSRDDVDAILLDLLLPDGSGLELLPSIRAKRPDVPVIIFSNAVDLAWPCLERGANGFVGKDAPSGEVAAAIRSALHGDVFVSSAIAGRGEGSSGSGREELAPHVMLSRRELDVILKLVRGMRPKEIALELGISAKTVDTYRSRGMKKLGVADTRALLLYALRHGLADWD